MKGYHQLPSKESGTATIELIVGCLAAIPLFFGVSLLGKYADMRHKTVEAARYVAWEEVIWQNSKGNDSYQLEASDRLMGHRHASIVDTSILEQQGVSEDPLWRDQSTRTLMVSDGSTVRVDISEERNTGSTKHNAPIKEVASKAGLNTDGITKYQVSLPVTNRLRVPNPGEPTTLSNFFNPAHYLPPEVMAFSSTSAILSDTWQADDLSSYNKRIRKLTLEDELDLAVMPGTQTFGNIWLFKEGDDGANPDIVAAPEALLQVYTP